MTADERRRTALHEAGHGVAGHVLGIPVEYASIRPGQTFRGIAVTAPRETPDAAGLPLLPSLPGTPPTLRADVERRVIAGLAGDLAAFYLAAEPAATGRTSDESETIARDALAALGPRLAELVVEHERREEGTDADEARAWDLASAIVVPEAAGLYVELLRHEARALVIRYAPAIVRVADALERQAVLSGAQVAALVAEA